jgi:hypothetical protein
MLAAGMAGLFAAAQCARAQSVDGAELILRVDAAAHARYEHVQSFTDVEHYAVFRGADRTHPAAEMTVRTTYRKGVGKTYQIVSQSGSVLIQRFGFRPLLEHEKEINDPAQVEHSWFTSANYEMRVAPEQRRLMDGRDCVAIEMKPRRKAPNMIDGVLWVDAKDGTLVEMDGVASKDPSIFAGTTHMMRHYTTIDGYAMATHSQAESNSRWFGRTVVTIDYSQYQVEVK